MSGLDVDYDDNYLLTVQHDTGHKGVLCVDVVCGSLLGCWRCMVRICIYRDGTPNGLKLFDFDIKKEKQLECMMRSISCEITVSIS